MKPGKPIIRVREVMKKDVDIVDGIREQLLRWGCSRVGDVVGTLEWDSG